MKVTVKYKGGRIEMDDDSIVTIYSKRGSLAQYRAKVPPEIEKILRRAFGTAKAEPKKRLRRLEMVPVPSKTSFSPLHTFKKPPRALEMEPVPSETLFSTHYVFKRRLRLLDP